MINITHSVGGLTFVLIPLTFGFLLNSSIWAIILSIFLGQAMDMDLDKSGISKKKGFRSLSKIVQYWSNGHREQTHSIFFGLLIGLLTSPLSLYLSIVDQSSFIDNILIIITGVLSHGFLDMMNKKAIPLFYFPILNPIGKAKYYTWGNLIGTLFENISDYFETESKKYRSPTLGKVGTKLKKYSEKLKFNIGILVSSELEFKLITLPLLFLLFTLLIINGGVLLEKITASNNLIVHNVLFGLFIIFYGVIGNYLFINNGGLKDFFITAFKDDIKNWKWDDLKKLLWETNFTKIIIITVLLLSAYNNSQSYISNYGDFLGRLGLIFSDLKGGDGTLIERVLTFLKDVLVYLVL